MTEPKWIPGPRYVEAVARVLFAAMAQEEPDEFKGLTYERLCEGERSHWEFYALAAIEASQAPALVEALRRLADAADTVGVAHFDTDDMSEEVEEMQAATLAARALLAKLEASE